MRITWSGKWELPTYAQRLFDARDSGASDQQMRGIIAEGFKEVYFQDGGGRAMGLSDVEINDIDYLDLDYLIGAENMSTQFPPMSRSVMGVTWAGLLSRSPRRLFSLPHVDCPVSCKLADSHRISCDVADSQWITTGLSFAVRAVREESGRAPAAEATGCGHG